MSGILRLESLTKGNTLKQGDKTPLKYRLFDADGEKLNIAGKSAKVRLVYPDFLTIGYEKDGLTVAQDDTVTFTIDSVIPARIYHVEIIVDDKFVFPSRADEAKFTVDKSSFGTEANIIEIVGKDVLIQEVKSQVDTELQPLVTFLEDSEQAETQRATAESNRVSAEEQREIDHANRSAEFDGKADKVVIENLTKMDVRWVTPLGVSTNVEDEVTYEVSKPSSEARVEFAIDAVAGDLYYGYFEIYAEFPNISRFRLGDTVGVVQTPKIREWHVISDVLKSDVPARPKFYHSTAPNYNIGDKVKYRHMMALNLTRVFGTGNEPAKEEMDELVKVTGYIDGEYALNNKEILIWTLALIRRNKNAIIALGGA